MQFAILAAVSLIIMGILGFLVFTGGINFSGKDGGNALFGENEKFATKETPSNFPSSPTSGERAPFPGTEEEPGTEPENIVSIRGKEVIVDLANTPESRSAGLSGRTSLNENHGLLFVFESSGIYSFWMQDMNFAIDIIWVNENRKIVDISHDLKPESYPDIYSPIAPAKFAIEVNSGWAKNNGIEIGDEVVLP